MRSEDHLVICEMNKLFLTRLKNNIEKNQDFFLNRDRIQYHEGPVEDYAASNPESRFDLIICSLPFSNFSPEFVDRLMGIFALLLLEGGTFIFFEYVALRKLGQIFATAPVRSRMKAVDQVIDKWEKRAQQTGVVESRVALLNIPPAITFQFSYH
jgi:phospholipid N-methyltransferase